MKIYILFILSFFTKVFNQNIDLDIIGFVDPYGGIGQCALSFIECLKNDLKIQLYNIYPEETRIKDLNTTTKKIVEKGINLNNNYDSFESKKVCLYTHILSTPNWNKFLSIKKKGITIAYSMVESSQVLKDWVKKLNSNFDAVVVPDEYLVNTYRESGVIIPIFVLPLALNLKKFNKLPQKDYDGSFIFGNSAGFESRKNHILLIEAFYKVFGNNKNVFLILHGKGGGEYQKIRNKIDELKSNNIILIKKDFSMDEYVSFIKSLNCYISISLGEGYSISPREAMATKIPIILSKNTAHITLCNSGYVLFIRLNLK